MLPCLLHVLALLVMTCQMLPDPASAGFALSPIGHTAFETRDLPPTDDVPRMARLATDTDDLRAAFALPIPRALPAAPADAAFGVTPADHPATREVHPPDRPPRRLA